MAKHDFSTLQGHGRFWQELLDQVKFQPSIVGTGKPVHRRRQRRPSIARALRDAAKAGVTVDRVEFPDGTALILGEPQSAAAVNDLDTELAAFEAKHHGPD